MVLGGWLGVRGALQLMRGEAGKADWLPQIHDSWLAVYVKELFVLTFCQCLFLITIIIINSTRTQSSKDFYKKK